MLVLVEVRRAEIAHPVCTGDAAAEGLTRVVGDLESACCVAKDCRYAGLGVKHGGCVAEKVALEGAVVNCIDA